MARLHSKKKGKAGRKRPKAKTTPEWLEIKPAEVEEAILQMTKEGMAPTAIGLRLRDNYAVPSVRALLGMTLNAFLKKQGKQATYPDDLLNLIRRAMKIRTHLKTSKKDNHNRVKLLHIESKIHRLVKYYTRNGRLPSDWRYEPEKAALLVK